MHLFLRVFLPWKRPAVLKPHRNSWRRLYRSYMNKKSCLFAGEISLGWPDWLCCLKPACLQINTRKSPHVRESKTVSGFYPVDSWLLIPDSRYRIPASLSLEQSLVAFGILELYSGFQSLGFQIPQAKISQIPWTKTFKTVLRRISYGAGPLATSSLAVGRLAAKKGSLSSPRGRGRLIASLLWTKKTNKRSIAYVVDTLAILLLCKWLFFSLRQASFCL